MTAKTADGLDQRSSPKQTRARRIDSTGSSRLPLATLRPSPMPVSRWTRSGYVVIHRFEFRMPLS